jgi:hypothetical protein
MATHDRYETDILKQLKRIAFALEYIGRGMPHIPEANIDTDGVEVTLFNQQNKED